MIIRYNHLLILGFLYISGNVFGAGRTVFNHKILQNFEYQTSVIFQEKVYLQTDKPLYSAGENIWFKGYLVNASSHVPKSLSKFLYVELIDQSNAIVKRLKIKKDSTGGFAGMIKLAPEFQAGYYQLKAYTSWMQNTGTDFFFHKNIFIGNPIDDSMNANVTYDTVSGAQVNMTLTFTNASRNPVANQKLDVIQKWNNPEAKSKTYTTNKAGKVFVQLNRNDSSSANPRVFEVSMSKYGNDFRQKFYLPSKSSNGYDVQFFPESGILLAGQSQIVGFKAIGTDGLSVDVTGSVFNSKNKEVSSFISSINGMGKFAIQVDSAESYYAIVKSSDGIEKRFNLPETHLRGLSLQLLHKGQKVLYELQNRTSSPSELFRLLIHSRGNVLALKSLNNENGQIDATTLPPGIISVAVVDTLGNMYCERLIFIRDAKPAIVQVKSNKSDYGKRDSVDLDIHIQSADAKPCVGGYSISVTDKKVVPEDSVSDNIMTHLLMTSDLKGYIESPGSYFTNDIESDREHVDVLMLTQGWRRFNTADVVKGKFKRPDYDLEVGQAVSGVVLNLFNKPAKMSNVFMLVPSQSFMTLGQTDKNGRFMIDGIDFPDSTNIILKAKKSKTIGDVEIIPDKDTYPDSTAFIPYKSKLLDVQKNEFLQQSKLGYYAEGGMRVVHLKDVVVTASKPSDFSDAELNADPDASINQDVISKYPGETVLSLIQRLPGVMVSGTDVFVRGSRKPALITVDENEDYSVDEISYLTAEEVERIDLFDGPGAAIYGGKGGNGVIAITLRSGVEIHRSKSVSVAVMSPLGYQKPVEFYMPKYDIDSIRVKDRSDLRTTIYWNPHIQTDSNGNAHVRFYTADRENDYLMILEGISAEGDICRYVATLKRKKQ